MPFAEFDKSVIITDQQLNKLLDDATAEGIRFNEKEYLRSRNYIRNQIKALVARSIYQKGNKAGQNNEFFQVINNTDDTYKKALQLFDRANRLQLGEVTYNDADKK